MPIVTQTRPHVSGGVDTHRDFHVAAVLDDRGALLATSTFTASADGYVELLEWVAGYGLIDKIGVEGTGSYGAGLSCYLQANNIKIVEVDRPNRQLRHRIGKTDTIDAVSAARAVLSGEATATPKVRGGCVDSIRALRVPRRSAKEARVDTLNQMRALVVNAPDALRAQLAAMTIPTFVDACARLRPGVEPNATETAVRYALRDLARRVRFLDNQIHGLDVHLARLIEAVAPELYAVKGVGVDTAGALLCAAGDNADRIRNEAAFARLCGVAPIEVSSGQHQRHRLHRGGDRQANQALWRIVMVRLACDPTTRAYLQRRVTEGKSKREAIRCLKRYVAREIFPLLPKNP